MLAHAHTHAHTHTLSSVWIVKVNADVCDRSLGGEVSHDGDFMIFEGNRYSRKGFLFKSFAMSAVVRRTSL